MSETTEKGPLCLSDCQVRSLGLKPADVLKCVEQAILRQTAPLAQALKSTVTDPSGSYFQALPSLLAGEAVAGVKWVSVTSGNGSHPSVRATILLTSMADGELLAVIDGTWITTARTAAMSALAARRLARPNSERVGFIGCGAQALSHLGALKSIFPQLRGIVACGQSPSSAAALCREAKLLGMDAQAVSDPREAVEGQDIVVSTVPAAGLQKPFLDGRWLGPGAFATMVDLGRSWKSDTLGVIDVIATDDQGQSDALASAGKLALAGPYDHDLTDLVGNTPTWDGRKKSAFVFGGLGLCDVAVALLCYRRTRAALEEGPTV